MVFTQLLRRSLFLLPLKPSPTSSAPKYICRYAGGQPAGGLAESAPEVCASPLVCHVWKGIGIWSLGLATSLLSSK